MLSSQRPRRFTFGRLTALTLCAAVFASATFAADPAAPRTGADVYETFCATCHSGGWQGAPVANDRAEWAPRVAKGAPALLAAVKQGVNGMPPMGTCMDCSDAELRAAIDEMTR